MLLCSYIDKGLNPDLFIKDMRSTGLHETEQVKSKMVALAVRQSLCQWAPLLEPEVTYQSNKFCLVLSRPSLKLLRIMSVLHGQIWTPMMPKY